MTRRAFATAAVLGATVLSALSMSTLIHPSLWVGRTLVCVTIVAVAVFAARSLVRSPIAASAIGLVVGALTLAAVFIPQASVLGVLPTQETLVQTSALVRSALEVMRNSVPPIVDHQGVALVVAAGIVLVYLLAELLAVGVCSPGWFGLPLLALWTIPLTIGARVAPWVVVATCTAFVAVLAIQARNPSTPFPRRRVPGAETRRVDKRALLATAVVATLSVGVAVAAAPALLRLPSPGRLHPLYELVGSNSTRLDLGLNLRADLLRDDGAVLISYATDDPASMGPLHSYTFTEFDGSQWHRTNGASEPEELTGQDLWPDPDLPATRSDRHDLAITIHNLNQDRLVIPGEPRSVQIEGNWAYDPAADEVIALGALPSPLQYVVEYTPRTLDVETLAGSDPRSVDVPDELLTLPNTGYAPEIADLTREIVADAGATTAYEQVLAVQNYLRDPARFTYTPVIEAARTPDAVWDFLNDRNGYCVQFATAMVMMLRTLDIPARLAIGFLPGEEQPDGTFAITGDRAHAWPQVLFPQLGWVRFEPTPSAQTGEAPQWAPVPERTPTPTAAPSPTDNPGTAPSTNVTTAAPATGSTTSGGIAASGSGGSRAATGVAIFSALVLLVAAVTAWRRHRANKDNLEVHWAHAVRALRHAHFDVSESLTPGGIARAAKTRLGSEAASALAALASAIEVERYAAAERHPERPEEAKAWAASVAAGARRANRGRSDSPESASGNGTSGASQGNGAHTREGEEVQATKKF